MKRYILTQNPKGSWIVVRTVKYVSGYQSIIPELYPTEERYTLTEEGGDVIPLLLHELSEGVSAAERRSLEGLNPSPSSSGEADYHG